MGNLEGHVNGHSKIYLFSAGGEERESIKISSTAHRIHVAIDPEEYAAVTAMQGGFLEFVRNPEAQSRAEKEFQRALSRYKPASAYHIALLRMARSYFGKGTAEEDYFFRGMETVSITLQEIFTPVDPSDLSSKINLSQYKENLERFIASKDSFVTARGIAADTDGIDKVVTQICAAPRLGQFLLEQGYKMIMGYYERMAISGAQR